MSRREPIASINRRFSDVRAQLLELGMSQDAITAAMPMMWFLPSTTTPYASSVIMLVEGIQHTLRRKGYQVPADGYVGPETLTVLRRIAGTCWAELPWVVVVGHVLAAPPAASLGHQEIAMYGLGDDEMVFAPTETSYTLTNSGSCKGTTSTVTARFKELQRQINRAVAGTKRGRTVKVDGVLGAATLAAAKAVADAALVEVGVVKLYSSCEPLAQNAAALASAFKSVADRRGVSAGGGGGGGVGSKFTELTAGVKEANPILLAALVAGGIVLWKKHQRGEL